MLQELRDTWWQTNLSHALEVTIDQLLRDPKPYLQPKLSEKDMDDIEKGGGPASKSVKIHGLIRSVSKAASGSYSFVLEQAGKQIRVDTTAGSDPPINTPMSELSSGSGKSITIVAIVAKEDGWLGKPYLILFNYRFD